jgi:hypothetical protein
LHSDFGRPGAVRMSTHAIEYQHDRGILTNHDCGPVLVVRAITYRIYFGVLDFHFS